MLIRALSNISKGICQIPKIPFVVEFVEPTEAEAETFSETVFPAIESSMPVAIMKAPFIFLFGAFVVLIVGQFKLVMKVAKAGAATKTPPTNPSTQEQGNA